jgi:uncharacterized protein YjbI with pentapeptide repeats
MNKNDLYKALELHSLWLKGDSRGKQFSIIGGNLEGIDLAGANLAHAYLPRVNLRNANLRGTNLSNACLSLADLSNADLIDANLKHASLFYTNLSNAILINTNLDSAQFTHTNLFGAIIKNASLNDTSLFGIISFMESRSTQDIKGPYTPYLFNIDDPFDI